MIEETYLIFKIIVIIITTILISKIVNKVLLGYFKKITKRLKIEETVYVFIRRIIIIVIYVIGIIIITSIIPGFQTFAKSLVAASGVLGIVIGLAAQKTVANLIAGISIAITRPFRVGDHVTIENEYGTVEDITLNQVVVNTWENKRLIIPNSVIRDRTIINWSIKDTFVLWHIDFNVAYDTNIDLARSIIIDETNKHENVMIDKDINVSLIDLGDFAMKLRLTFWVSDRNVAWRTGCDIMENVKKRFDKENIEIPFPCRTIMFKGNDKNNEQNKDI